MKFEIYTDGGCTSGGGTGGWAAIVYEGSNSRKLPGAEMDTTNQRMEIRAAIEGLKSLKSPSNVRLYSDSAYLINCMNEGWYKKWRENGWKTSAKKPVQNADLWRKLLELLKTHNIEWCKVKGHSGVPANEYCDLLVKRAIEKGRDHL